MRDTVKKITGLIMMMISVFPLFLGLYWDKGITGIILISSGILLLCVGFVMYKILKDADE